MELRVLRNFLTVAREENITLAANLLHLTQPTLSRQIQDLEEELGHKLFLRKSHRVCLTEEGYRFRQRAEEIVALADQALAEFAAPAGDLSGDVYIGCGETEVIHLLAEVAAQVQQEHPQVRFHLYSGNAQGVTERLDRGLLDFGLLISPYSLERYESLTLPEKERWWVLMRKDSPLAQLPAIRPEDLLGKPLILSQQAIVDRPDNEFRRWFRPRFQNFWLASTFNLIYNASALVAAGMGYALTIGRRIDTSSESPLCFRLLDPLLEAELSVVWKKDRVFSPAAALFLERMRQAFPQ